MKTTFKTVKNSVKHWYIPLIAGIIFVLTALYTFMQPLGSYLALSFIFVISFLVSGVIEVFFSIANRKEMHNWGWTLLFGLLDLFVGVILLSHPVLTMATLPLYVGFVIMFRSFSAVSLSLDLKKNDISDWGVMTAIGILGIIFSLLMIFNPVFGSLNIVYWTGFAFLLTGIFSIYLSIKLKKLKKITGK